MGLASIGTSSPRTGVRASTPARGATRSRRRTRPVPSVEAGLKAIACDGTAASKLANAEPLDFQGTGNPYQCGDLLENLPITGSVARRFSC